MADLLSGIQSPADVKRLTIPQLTQLAEEIRERLILGVSKTGGHIGPNLGVVELTLAMHYVFDTPRDSFVFDVSHQAYVHKLLTGRNDRFETIRQPGGLNGFMLRTESEHDSYGAGHAGTALSAALGMAVARDMSGGKEHIVALCGDAAFTNGVSFEALNNIAAQTKRMIVVLNDNAWSIDKNVGAIAEYFHKIVTNPTLSSLHDRAAGLLEQAGTVIATPGGGLHLYFAGSMQATRRLPRQHLDFRAAGGYVLSVFDRLGIAGQMKAKTKPQTTTGHIAEAVARGDAELGVFLVNVLIAPGTELAGSFPAELQQELVFTAAVAADSRQADAARAFIDYLRTPAATMVITTLGMTPG